MMALLIWIKNIGVLILSLFFLIIGINTLIGSYHLNNPFEFVMYFFSSSLLILVSIAGLIYCFFKIFFRKRNEITDDKTK
jgi:hypothetical protein